MIHKIKPFVDYNQWLKRLDTQLNKPIKVSKVVKPTNKETLLKTMGTSVINSPMSPLSLKFDKLNQSPKETIITRMIMLKYHS